MMIVALQSCSEKMTGDTIKSSKWRLAEWPGQTFPAVKVATLNIDAESKISGKSFCNGFGGNAVINGNAIVFEQIMGTMMYCEDVGQAEKIYLDGLKATTAFKMVDGKLQLYRGTELLMIFVKAE